MKKKVFMSIFAIVLCVAMASAATMAWFTDSDDAGEAVFTSGTVDIEAGGSAILSQYFDPSSAVYVYGTEAETGDLYEIDLQNHTANRIFDADMSVFGNHDQYSPNGLAFDNKNRRLYFSIINGGSSSLWFYDLKNKEAVKASSVAESRVIYGAAFGDGYYWYIANNTDALYKVSFDANGKVAASQFIANITGDLSKRFGFGDVVMDIKDGVIYGSSTSGVFFKYEIAKGQYQTISSGGNTIGLQLAFGSNGSLYGHSTNSKKWYTVDAGNGSVQEIYVGDKNFNDLASGYVSVWNPGDTDKLKYHVKNTGTKKIRIRAKLEGQWNDASLANNVVNVSLCPDYDNWFKGDDGYFYYKDIMEPGETAELCVVIHLDGPNTGNQYQGKTYTLSGIMYAIQASNDAPYHEWGVTYFQTP